MQNVPLPSSTLVEAVNQLPELKQELFYKEYNTARKSGLISFTLWILTFHHAYYRKWLVQILFWCTLGGLGVWWLIDLTRIRRNVNNWNHSLAVDLLNRV